MLCTVLCPTRHRTILIEDGCAYGGNCRLRPVVKIIILSHWLKLVAYLPDRERLNFAAEPNQIRRSSLLAPPYNTFQLYHVQTATHSKGRYPCSPCYNISHSQNEYLFGCKHDCARPIKAHLLIQVSHHCAPEHG